MKHSRPTPWREGDAVVVHHPEYGRDRGRVTNVTDEAVYVEGRHLPGDSRVAAYTIAIGQADEFLSLQCRPFGMTEPKHAASS